VINGPRDDSLATRRVRWNWEKRNETGEGKAAPDRRCKQQCLKEKGTMNMPQGQSAVETDMDSTAKGQAQGNTPR